MSWLQLQAPHHHSGLKDLEENKQCRCLALISREGLLYVNIWHISMNEAIHAITWLRLISFQVFASLEDDVLNLPFWLRLSLLSCFPCSFLGGHIWLLRGVLVSRAFSSFFWSFFNVKGFIITRIINSWFTGENKLSVTITRHFTIVFYTVHISTLYSNACKEKWKKKKNSKGIFVLKDQGNDAEI